MKKVIIALVVLAIILTAGILESIYIDDVFDELDARIQSLESAIHEENDSALTLTRELAEWWEDRRKYMELFTFSPDMRAFSVAVAEIEGSIEADDYQNAMSKCQSLVTMSRNMHLILDFNFEDII